MLGQQLLARAPSAFEVVGRDLPEMDITEPDHVQREIEDIAPEVVIHLAAMTAVDVCETEVESAFSVNGVGTGILAAACDRAGVALVYISTDYVFDGESDRPYVESDLVRPISVYGRSKWWGEQATRERCPRHTILRTQWLYGPGGPNFVDTMLRLAREGKPLKVVDDQVGCPTSTFDLADGIWEVVTREPGFGTYHLSARGEVSWFGFAREIFRLAGLAPALEPCSTADFPRPAPRPRYGVLRNLHLELRGGDPMPAWEEGLARFLADPSRDA